MILVSELERGESLTQSLINYIIHFVFILNNVGIDVWLRYKLLR